MKKKIVGCSFPEYAENELEKLIRSKDLEGIDKYLGNVNPEAFLVDAERLMKMDSGDWAIKKAIQAVETCRSDLQRLVI